MLNLTCDVTGALAGMQELADTQLPFAIAKALTRTAQAGQADSRALAGKVFALRNDWTTRNIRITPATKQTLSATVYTDTGNRLSGAPDYLPGQQDSYEKVPHNGRAHLAVPTRQLRQLAGGDHKPIPDWLRPKAMLKYAATAQTSRFGSYTDRRGRVRNQPKAINGLYFFKVTLKSGAGCILARHVTDVRDAAVPMYMLVTAASVRKRFPMEATVEATVQRVFEAEFTQALLDAHPLLLAV